MIRIGSVTVTEDMNQSKDVLNVVLLKISQHPDTSDVWLTGVRKNGRLEYGSITGLRIIREQTHNDAVYKVIDERPQKDRLRAGDEVLFLIIGD